MFGKFEVGLEADEVVKTACQIILPQLNDGIRTPACARVTQSDGTHGSVGKRINSAPGDDFDGQTAFKKLSRLHARLNCVFK